MQITKLNHLANIKITLQNCDEIIAESLELMKQASRLQLMKMQLEQHSMQIKRGLEFEQEHERNMEVNR